MSKKFSVHSKYNMPMYGKIYISIIDFLEGLQLIVNLDTGLVSLTGQWMQGMAGKVWESRALVVTVDGSCLLTLPLQQVTKTTRDQLMLCCLVSTCDALLRDPVYLKWKDYLSVIVVL